MTEQWDTDILMVDTANPGPAFTYDEITGTGGGGSEIEMAQIARALADRGYRVIVAQKSSHYVEEHGIRYTCPTNAQGMSARALYLARGSEPPHMRTRRTVIRATDCYGLGYDVHRSRLWQGATLACVSRWQADGFARLPGDRVVIPAMIDPVPNVPKVPGRFVYAGSPGRGMRQTLEAWRTLKRRHRDELRGATLAIVIPGQGCDALPTITEEDRTELGITFHGAPAPAGYREFIASAVGLFYVARPGFQETYCVQAAIAELAGARTHILCPDGTGGLSESLSCTRLVTTERETFERDFLAAWLEPERAEWRPACPLPDRSPAALVHEWERVLFDEAPPATLWTYGQAAPAGRLDAAVSPREEFPTVCVGVGDPKTAKASVAILTPVKNGLPPEYVQQLVVVTAALWERGITWEWMAQPDMALTEARNHLASRMLRATKHTHALWLDADCRFEVKDLWRLLALDVDFAALPYGLRRNGGQYGFTLAGPDGHTVLDDGERPTFHGGAIRCLGVDFGTVLMRRTVLEQMAAAHPELGYDEPEPGTAFFQEMICDRHRLTDDYAFCRRWRDLGGSVWVLVDDVRTWHAGREAYAPKGALRHLGRGAEAA